MATTATLPVTESSILMNAPGDKYRGAVVEVRWPALAEREETAD